MVVITVVMMTVAITMMAPRRLVVPPNIEDQSRRVVSHHVEELAVEVDLVEGTVALTVLSADCSPPSSDAVEVKEAPQRPPLHLLLGLGLSGVTVVNDELRELLERGEVKVSASVDAAEICGGGVERVLHPHGREDVVQFDRRAVAEERQLQVDVDGMQGAHQRVPVFLQEVCSML